MDLFGAEEDEDEAASVANAVVRVLCQQARPLASYRMRSTEDGTSSNSEREAVCDRLRLAGLARATTEVAEVAVGAAMEGCFVIATRGIVDEAWWAPCSREYGWTVARKRDIAVDTAGCAPWGSPDAAERERLEACCKRPDDLVGAARSLRDQGLVVLPGLVNDVAALKALAAEALSNAELCRLALLENHGVDIVRPHASAHEAASYREVALREDCRCDVRLALVEGERDAFATACARAEAIARLAAAPPEPRPFVAGNYGRYNFDDGGPLAPPEPMLVCPFATVVSFPGAAEQALHADTPHIFDHTDLPGHYFNLFLSPNLDPPAAGHTAFVIGSHVLRTCADLTAGDGKLAKLRRRLVRPRLRPGDAIIFDARLLHFGLPNRSQATRPLVYANIYAHWFKGDPKNWDDACSVFQPPRDTHSSLKHPREALEPALAKAMRATDARPGVPRIFAEAGRSSQPPA